jgi:hypothetical protein
LVFYFPVYTVKPLAPFGIRNGKIIPDPAANPNACLFNASLLKYCLIVSKKNAYFNFSSFIAQQVRAEKKDKERVQKKQKG